MADTVLQTQELCDYITDFLHSSADLKSCALVSPQFTASAQRHLFHDIILNPGCSRIDGYGIRRSFDEAGACRRLCLVLKGSPHLTRLVRRLRASLEDEVIKQLATVKFSNLEELFLNRRRGGVSKSSVLLSAAEIIGLPSIRHVGLLFLIFRDMHDLARLFEKCTDQLQALYLDNTSVLPYFDTPDPLAFAQRAKIKRLHFAGDRTRKYWAWLLHPLCSFDLTELHDVDGGGMNVFSPASALLELSCSTIERLVIGTGGEALNLTGFRALKTLTRLPALTHLTLNTTDHHLADIQTILAPLLPSNLLEHLTFNIMPSSLDPHYRLDSHFLEGLTLVLPVQALPALRCMEVVLKWELHATREEICTALAQWDAIHMLKVVLP